MSLLVSKLGLFLPGAVALAPWPSVGADPAGGLLLTAKATALFLAAWLVLLLLRRRSPALRHGLLSLVFVGALSLPLLSLVLPAWQVVPQPWTEVVAMRPALAAPPHSRAGAVAGLGETLPPQGSPGRTEPPGEPGEAAPPPPEPVVSSGVLAPLSTILLPAITPVSALAIWAAVAGGLLLLLALRVLSMQRFVRGARPLSDPRWLAHLGESRRELGIEVAVELRVACGMPLVWGLRRPVLVVPAEALGWSGERIRAVLAHELAHVVQRDVLRLLLARAACALYWFHPLAWILERRQRIEREHACDELVLAQGMRPADYASHLLEIASSYSKTTQRLAPIMATRTDLEGRIMAILDTKKSPHRRPRPMTPLVLALTLLLLLPLASLGWSSSIGYGIGGTTTLFSGAIEPAATEETESTEETTARVLSRRTRVRPGAGTPGQPYGDSDVAAFQQRLAELAIDASDFERLIECARSDSALTRGACVWALGESEDPRAVEPLIASLTDRDATVRQWAARGLGSLGDERAVDPLIDGLDDDDAETRQWLTRSLGSLGDERAVLPLIARLDDHDAEVRQWVARSLGSLGDERAIEPLAARADDPDPEVRQWIVRSLADLGGDAALETLTGLLSDEDAEVRQWTVRSLAGADVVGSAELVRDLLEDEDPEVRQWAVRAMTEAEGVTVDLLRRRLEDPDPEVRQWAVRSIGEIGPEGLQGELVDELIAALDDPDAEVQQWAVRALAASGDPGEVRDWRLPDGEEPLLPGLERGPRRPAEPRIIDALLRTLDRRDAEVRQWAVRSLGDVGDETVVGALIERTADPDNEVSEWAIRSLASIGDRRATGPLIDLLAADNATLREWAVRGLGQLQDPVAILPLLDRCEDPSATVREWAARVLGAFGDPVAEGPLTALLDDPAPEVRYWAERALPNLQK